jgi:hypothetical protein
MRKISIAGTLLATIVGQPAAYAASIIENGTIQIGVGDAGQLGTLGGVASPVEGEDDVGLRFIPTGNEALAHGCICEGWGAGNGTTRTYGYVSNANIENLNGSFESTTQTAVAINTVAEELRVTHSFAPSANPGLFEITVSMTNVSAADITDVRYTRAIDWDIEPTAYNEVVLLGGMSAATSLLQISTDAGVNPHPFALREQILTGTTIAGPGDIGTTFDFAFGNLRQGESLTFKIFYGAAENQALALTALGSVAAELYAIGMAACDVDAGGIGCSYPSNAFMVGFSGIGGTPLSNGDVPIPGGLALLLSGLVGLGGFTRKHRAKTQL